jgi:hypothetical protein
LSVKVTSKNGTIIEQLIRMQLYSEIVKVLQPHSYTQSHWSSGSTICFLPRGAVVHVPGMHPHLQWNWVLLLAMSPYIGDLDVIWSLASSPFSRCFTRLCANDVKSRRLCCPSLGASVGLAPPMWKDDVITHHLPSPVPFLSLQVLLLLATHWPVRAPGQVAGGGGEPCGGPTTSLQSTSLTGPVGQPFASR